MSMPSATADPEAVFQAALARHQAGDGAGAETLYRAVLAARPRHAGALGLMGALSLQRGQYAKALTWLEASLAAEPGQPPALNNRGYALNKLGRHAEALAAFDAALALSPDYAEAHNNRGNALRDLERHAEALAAYERAIALKPDFAEAINNRGNCLQKLKRHAEALAHYERVIALKPDLALGHLNRGTALTDLGRLDEAEAAYDRAIALNPAYADALWAKGMLRLLRGDYATGWRLYHWRWQRPESGSPSPAMTQRLWLGETSPAGRTLLLHAEQGFGDTIQFARYARLAQAAGARVVMVVQPELKALMAELDPPCELLLPGEAVPAFDLFCPLMSLPLAFKTTLDTVPAQVPYLRAPADRAAGWRQRLGARTRPRVGLVWSGRPTHRNDAHRSIGLDVLRAVLDCGAEFHALQVALREEDRAALARDRRIAVHAQALRDFADTAALTAEMDLIISVDTAVAHLAGALGKPVWILLPFAPDFRWLLGREDSPWYPTARLFRQPRPDSWPEVIARVAENLTAWLSAA